MCDQGKALGELERVAGAQQAQDLDWAVTHAGVARECLNRLVRTLHVKALYCSGAAPSRDRRTLGGQSCFHPDSVCWSMF